MPKVDPAAAPERRGSAYPPPFDAPCQLRSRRQLGDAAGLTQFGVNLLTLPPGQWSSQRHWHEAEDEFVAVLQGEVVLVTNAGETVLRAGDFAGFPAGAADAHHLQNRGPGPALILEIGSRRPEEDSCHYPDIDLDLPRGRSSFTKRDGGPV